MFFNILESVFYLSKQTFPRVLFNTGQNLIGVNVLTVFELKLSNDLFEDASAFFNF